MALPFLFIYLVYEENAGYLDPEINVIPLELLDGVPDLPIELLPKKPQFQLTALWYYYYTADSLSKEFPWKLCALELFFELVPNYI